jgi:hypothetical protein
MNSTELSSEVAPGMTLADLLAIVVGVYVGLNPPPHKAFVRLSDGRLVYHEWRPEQVPGFNTPGQQT